MTTVGWQSTVAVDGDDGSEENTLEEVGIIRNTLSTVHDRRAVICDPDARGETEVHLPLDLLWETVDVLVASDQHVFVRLLGIERMSTCRIGTITVQKKQKRVVSMVLCSQDGTPGIMLLSPITPLLVRASTSMSGCAAVRQGLRVGTSIQSLYAQGHMASIVSPAEVGIMRFRGTLFTPKSIVWNEPIPEHGLTVVDLFGMDQGTQNLCSAFVLKPEHLHFMNLHQERIDMGTLPRTSRFEKCSVIPSKSGLHPLMFQVGSMRQTIQIIDNLLALCLNSQQQIITYTDYALCGRIPGTCIVQEPLGSDHRTQSTCKRRVAYNEGAAYDRGTIFAKEQGIVNDDMNHGILSFSSQCHRTKKCPTSCGCKHINGDGYCDNIKAVHRSVTVGHRSNRTMAFGTWAATEERPYPRRVAPSCETPGTQSNHASRDGNIIIGCMNTLAQVSGHSIIKIGRWVSVKVRCMLKTFCCRSEESD